MTKTLTEQWREGKLPEDCYYILTKNGHIKKDRSCFYSHIDEQCFCFTTNKDIEEVLAPVPSYDEVKEMSQKIERLELDNEALEMAHNEGNEINAELVSKTEQLEKQLAIATKALEQYANCKPTEWMTCVTAQKALKDIKEVK